MNDWITTVIIALFIAAIGAAGIAMVILLVGSCMIKFLG